MSLIASLGEGLEDAERERRFERLATSKRPEPGKLEVLFKHRFEGDRGPGPIGVELPKRFHLQVVDVANELSDAIEKLESDWWSVEMLLSPIREDLDGVLMSAKVEFTIAGIKHVIQAVAKALDEFVNILELRRFKLGAESSPACWAPEGNEKAFAEGTRFAWGGSAPIRSWALRCREFDGAGPALIVLRKLSAAVDAITAWVEAGSHGVDALPPATKSAAPLSEMASASPDSLGLSPDGLGEDGAAELPDDPQESAAPRHARPGLPAASQPSSSEGGAADPALRHMPDADAFEAALAAAKPKNGAGRLVTLMEPPPMEKMEHVLRRRPRTLQAKGK